MAKRTYLSVVAVSATASALLGGLTGAASGAVTAGERASAGRALARPAFTALTPALAERLSQAIDDPVIVVLKRQAGARPAPSAARTAEAALDGELHLVRATGIKRFTLVNSIAATVSALEAQRLAADPAVAEVIPDARFAVPDPSLAAAAAITGAGRRARPVPVPLHRIPGACAPADKSLLAPEGLALTSSASDTATAPTAQSLGFTGAGLKVAFIADGVDPDNVNLRRNNGTSVFADYRDFTGNGPGVPTGGGEAFLDANTIAGQGAVVYNLNHFAAQSYPGSCDVRIRGVAPGASLVGLDAFSGDSGNKLITTTSTFAQAINYAVENDKVNVINESFGGVSLPDTTQDVVKLFDDAAVRAGVVVTVSSGDAGTANTITSPASDPNVINVGASTQFQALAQADIDGARYFATKGWLSDNISSVSSAGFDEAGRTVDLVAPGDGSWASCDADINSYSDCVNDVGNPSDVEEAAGTSESAPFVAGAAALVIQAFRHGHDGRNPTPSLVKQILLSTATDLGAPAQEQGAGLLDSYRAVQLAESYGTPRRTGTTLIAWPGQLTGADLPGAARTWKVTVTNEGIRPQVVRISGRTLSPQATSSASGSVTLNDSSSSQYTADSGTPVNYATFTFRVPAGQGRLDVAVAYPASQYAVFVAPGFTLFDPDGRVAADAEPQGVGNYDNVDVRAPAAGLWTAVVAGAPVGYGGYNGKVVWQAVTQDYAAFGHYSPSALSLAPGQAKSFTLSVRAPSSPGDLAASIQLRPGLGAVTSIPVVVRTRIDVAGGGAFSGVLTGGNGRGNLATTDYYQVSVPAHQTALRAELALRDNPGAGNPVGAYLVSPDGNVLGSGQNSDLSAAQLGVTVSTLTATVLHPVAGLWTLIVALGQPVAGTEVSDPFTGTVAFATAGREDPAAALPEGRTLVRGRAVTIPVRITNTSNAPQDYYLDPRLDRTATLTLAPLGYGAGQPFEAASATSALPLLSFTVQYFVPSETSSATVRQTSTAPAMTDLAAVIGDPDTGRSVLSVSSLCARSASVSYRPSGGRVMPGDWQPEPTECGPYRSAAPSGSATDTMSVATAGFDPTVSVSTGDLDQLAQSASAGNTAMKNAVELRPGRSATVKVTFRPAGRAGTLDAGRLYLDAVQGGVPPGGQLSADEVAVLPYSYRVG